MTTPRTKRDLIERVVVALAFSVTLAVNALANILPIGGRTTGAISDQYPTLFTPAGFTFSIWGVIYLGLGAFVAYQAFAPHNARPLLRKISPWFVINCLANASWIFAWHNEAIWASLAIMLAILGTLVRIFLLVSNETREGDSVTSWFVRVPFSIYTAWICVATIANVSVLQSAVGVGTEGGVAIAGTIVKLAVAGAVAVGVLHRWRNRSFALVVAWAAFGIASNQADTTIVSGAAWAVTALLLLMVALSLTSIRFSTPTAPSVAGKDASALS